MTGVGSMRQLTSTARPSSSTASTPKFTPAWASHCGERAGSTRPSPSAARPSSSTRSTPAPGRYLAHLERVAACEDKIPDFLKGDFAPTTNDERLGLAEWCRIQKRNQTAARLFTHAFASDPK